MDERRATSKETDPKIWQFGEVQPVIGWVASIFDSSLLYSKNFGEGKSAHHKERTLQP